MLITYKRKGYHMIEELRKQFEELRDKEISMFLKAIEHELKKGVSNEYRR